MATVGSLALLLILAALLPGRVFLPANVLVVDILTSFAAQYALLALLMALGLLWQRRWLRGAAFLLLLLPDLFSLFQGRGAPPLGEPAITVVSANLFESARAVRSAVAQGEALDADLIWWSEFPRDLDPETRGRVGALDARYPFGFEMPAADGRDLRFLSRFPLRTRETFQPPHTTGRPALKLTLEVEGRLLTVFALHTHPPTSPWSLEARNATLDWLQQELANLDGYALVLGDLNTSAFAPRFRELLDVSGLHCPSVWRCSVASWPSFVPILLTPIDHILAGGGAEVVNLRRGRFTGSDHFPVVAEVAFRD
ncbi:MAG: endonuclease/exonuclease/phosphatase family protein [Gammaproteobacteria bacterium]|nr:endonuclease/exonuclease/phosphatase family protein [Gammaproteobacteria bacterium]